MASPGELSYRLFVTKLVQKASSHYINVMDTQNLGSYYWGLFSEAFKQERREKDKRKAFWNVAIYLKECVVNQKMDDLFDLWQIFDTNGRNMWETLYENSITHQVNRIL